MRVSDPLTTVASPAVCVPARWVGAALVWLLTGSTDALAQQVAATPATPTAESSARGTPGAASTDPESMAISDRLREYRDALAALDVGRVAAIWPTVDQKALARAFGRLEQQFLVFEQCTITVKAPRAEAHCTGNARVVPRVGGRSPQYRSGEWHFVLGQTDDGWKIQAVEATGRPSVR